MNARMIPTDKIDIDANVRTNYPMASIVELADSIEKDKLMYPPAFQEKDGRFKLKIGGRRYRALILKNPTEIPGFVGNMSEDQWERLQLIENIQREDLPAKDLINGVWRLYEKNGHDLNKTMQDVKKKKSWVSKKIAVKMKAGPLTAKLLEADVKDTELLYSFTKLETMDTACALELVDGIIGRTIGRDEVRTALKLAAAGGQEKEEKEESTVDMFPEDLPDPDINKSNVIELKAAANDLLELLENWHPTEGNPARSEQAGRLRKALEKVSQAKS